MNTSAVINRRRAHVSDETWAWDTNIPFTRPTLSKNIMQRNYRP